MKKPHKYSGAVAGGLATESVLHADYVPLGGSRSPMLYVAAMHEPHGFSGTAFVLTDATGRHELVASFAPSPGTTVNASAYHAALLSLYYALHAGLADPADPLQLTSHHEIVIRQLEGSYALRAPALRVLHDEVKAIAKHFAALDFQWVRRPINPAAKLLDSFIEGAA